MVDGDSDQSAEVVVCLRGKAETIGHAASRTELLRETSHSADPSGMPIAPGAGECIYRTVPVFIWTVRKLTDSSRLTITHRVRPLAFVRGLRRDRIVAFALAVDVHDGAQHAHELIEGWLERQVPRMMRCKA